MNASRASRHQHTTLKAKPNPVVATLPANTDKLMQEFSHVLSETLEKRKQEGLLHPVVGKVTPTMVNKHLLKPSPCYQRDDVRAATVIDVTSSPNMVAFGALIVGKRKDGTLWIVDGQHRWAAIMHRDDVTEVLCLIFDSEGEQHEAHLFVLININNNPVKAPDKFRARVAEGDPTALFVKHVLDELNIEVCSRGRTGPNQLAAIDYAYSMAQKDQGRLRDVIEAVQMVSAGGPIYGELVKGFNWCDRKVEGGVKNKFFINRMVQIGAHKLMDAIKANQHVSNGTEQIGRSIAAVFNRGLPEAKHILV